MCMKKLFAEKNIFDKFTAHFKNIFDKFTAFLTKANFRPLYILTNGNSAYFVKSTPLRSFSVSV